MSKPSLHEIEQAEKQPLWRRLGWLAMIWTGSVLASLGLNVPAAMAGAFMPSIGLEQLLAVNPAWLLVAHYREESIVKRWQQDPLWQMLTAAQKQQVASVDSNTWARMRGICAAERIAADTVKIFHHQPLTDMK